MLNRLINHKEVLLKLISIIFLLVFVLFVLLELGNLNLKEYERIFLDLSLIEKVVVVILGFGAFSANTLYDHVVKYEYDLPIDNRMLIKASIIAQGFNNFISFGGITGGKLRALVLEDDVSDPDTPLKLTLTNLASFLLGACSFIVPSLLVMRTRVTPVLFLLGFLILYIPIYFFIQKIPAKGRLQKWSDSHSPFHFLNYRIKVRLWLTSLLDWTCSASFFALCTWLVKPGMPYFQIAASYIIAQMVGVITLIPGGIGSFDLTAGLLLKSIGLSTSESVIIIILFRIGYYLIPWFISTIMYIHHVLSKHLKEFSYLPIVISNSNLVVGFIILLSVVSTPDIISEMSYLDSFYAQNIALYARAVTFVLAILIMILSRGLRKRSKLAYQLSMGVLPLTAAFCLLKGFDFEEATMLLILAFVLFYAREMFE